MQNTEWPDLKDGVKERYYGHPYSYFAALDNPERKQAVPANSHTYGV